MTSCTIWKFQVPIEDRPSVSVPDGATFLAVQEQYGHLCLWFEVDPKAEPVERRFRIYGTGHPLDIGHHAYVYRGTTQQLNGRLVWHLYEVKP